MFTEIAPAGDTNPVIVCPVHHQRRYADRRQDMPDIDFAIHARNRHSCRWTAAETLVSGNPFLEDLVFGQARRYKP
jgi:hypothetical protein